MGYKPISDYGFIGNMISAALVSTDGSIDWCCLPRFDAPSVFAAILDDKKGGRFQIRPQVPFQSQQAYISATNVLQTTFKTGGGTATVTDFLPRYSTSQGRRIRLPEVHRWVECTEGRVALEALFEPRLDYARADTRLVGSKHGMMVKAGTEELSLSSLIPFTIDKDSAVGRFTLEQGEKAGFVLRYGSSKPSALIVHNSAAKLEGTVAYWQGQADGCDYSGPWREAIVRSYLALHLLVYEPTGAIIAAPTTSLPEEIGGERNWDYRYVWLRDASLTLSAFFHLGHKEEAVGFMKGLLTVCGQCGPEAQILHDIDFADPIDEQALSHLEGYRHSRPVRIGNDAYRQRQLDVFGEVLDAAYNYLGIGGYIGHDDWALLESFVDAVCELWQQPDNGIWEVRGSLHHFVHSKLMCWVAVDRGIKMAKRLGYKGKLGYWQKTVRQLRDDILTRGWNSQQRAFTQHYDTSALDASNLLMPLFGFLPVSDERVASTIQRTVEKLSRNGLLRRYNTDEIDDGLSGSEGVFLWCSFWLVRNMIRLHRLDDAVALYQKLLSCSNHLGLFSEMVDPVSREALGNFPQALTHLAVIITGWELTQAREKQTA